MVVNNIQKNTKEIKTKAIKHAQWRMRRIPLIGILLFLAAASFHCRRDTPPEQPPLLPPPGLFRNIDLDLSNALNRNNVTTPSIAATESDAMVELGRALFFDKVLSGDRNISCATCHHPTAGTGDALPVSIGAGGSGTAGDRIVSGGVMIPRNAPPLFNLGAASATRMFWDGRVHRDANTGELTTPETGLNGTSPTLAAIAAQLTTPLAAQAMFPVTSDTEMRGNPGNEIRDAAGNEAIWRALMARLVGTSNGTVGGIAGYRTLFNAAFPDVTNYDDFNFGHAARAIAAFEISAYTALNSPLDRFIAGDTAAMSDSAKQGALMFFGRRAGCGRCHNGPLLSNFDFHAVANPQLGPGAGGEVDDRGLALETGDTDDNYKFRTSPLRNIELTPPYTHAGAYTTLEAVVRHYNDTASEVRNYDAGQLGRSDFISTVDTDTTRIGARVAARDNRVRRVLNLNQDEIDDMVAFLQALTDPASRDPASSEPTSVPSGLTLVD